MILKWRMFAGAGENGASMEPGQVKAKARTRSLTGSWVVTTTVQGMPPFKSLFTFTEDGGLVSSTSFIVPFRPPIIRAVFSTSHGAWNSVANGEFSIALVALIHDEDAEFSGTAEVRGTIEIDETKDAFFGTVHAADLDPNGRVIFAFEGSIKGERIRSQP
jgi:hypothetical protein